MCEISSKLTLMAPERHLSRFIVLIVNFELISYISLAFLILALCK